MEYLAELPISHDALGLIVASVIFLVTVMLIAKKLINFVITIVLLFFAIASGMAIAHNDLVREYLRKEKLPHHEQNDDNFLEPLRDEAVQLLNRITELVRTQAKSPSSTSPEVAPVQENQGSAEERPSLRLERPEQSPSTSRTERIERNTERNPRASTAQRSGY